MSVLLRIRVLGKHALSHRPAGIIFSKTASSKIIVPSASIMTRGFSPNYKKDGVEPGNIVIFSSSMKLWVFASYLSVGATVVPTIAQAAFMTYNRLSSVPVEFQGIDDPLLFTMTLGVFGAGLFESLRRLISPTVLRIYYNDAKDEYTLIRRDWKLQLQKFTFNVDDVDIRQRTSILKDMYGNYKIKGHAVYLTSKDFRSMSYYTQLLGNINKKLYKVDEEEE